MKSNWALLIAAISVVSVVGCSAAEQGAPEQDKNPAANTSTNEKPDSQTQVVAFTNEKGQALCPVTGDVVASTEKASFQDYNGKRYYFCCESCPPQFKASPDKYADGKAIKSGEAKSMGGH